MDAAPHDTGGSSVYSLGTTSLVPGAVPVSPAPVLHPDELRELQLRALEAVADRWSPVAGRRRVPAGGAAEGLAVLLAALPPGVEADGDGTGPAASGRRRRGRRGHARSCTDDLRRGEGATTERAILRRVVLVTGRLADAGHRAAITLSAVGREDEAEVADGVSSCAHALRMLAEIELSTIPGP